MAWLWFDDSSKTLEEKVKMGARVYLRRFKAGPETCLVHKDYLKEGQQVEIAGIIIESRPFVLECHFQFA